MRNLNIRGFAVAAFIAAGAVLAGCSGGGVKSLPPSTPMSNQTVTTTLSITIGGTGQSAIRNGQTIPASNSKSLVIRYVGDPNPASAPTNPFAFPATAPAATGTPVNLTTGAGGNCTAVGANLQCTITGVTLVVGIEDIYVLVYDNVNGTGNLIYGSVTTVQVNSNGTLTAPNTTTPVVALNPAVGNAAAPGATITFTGSPVTLTPNAAPLATASPFPISGPLQVQAKDTNGNVITGGFSPVTVTNGDTSGNTCLRYLAGGAAATPCPFSSAGQSVTVKSSTDQIVVQYNNAPMSVAGFKLSAVQPAPSASPATVTATVNFQPASFVGVTPANAVNAVQPFGSNVYAGSGPAGAAPNVALTKYSFTTGTLAAATGIPTTATTGIGATQGALGTPAQATLQQPIVGLTIGPDNNIWFVEFVATHVYVGVYAVSGPASNGAVAQGAIGESTDLWPANATIGNGSALTGTAVVGITSMGGYIWVLTNKNEVVRIDPSNLQNTGGLGIIKALGGVGNAPPVAPAWNGGVTAVGSSLYLATAAGNITKTSPSTAPVPAGTGGTFLLYAAAGTPATYTTTSPTIGAVALDGIISASDGNLWSPAANGTPIIFAPPSMASTGQLAQTNNLEGSIVQGGPDNVLFTTTSVALTGLYYTSTSAATTGVFVAPAGCVPAAGATGLAPTGAALGVLPGGYLVQSQVSAANLCVAIP